MTATYRKLGIVGLLGFGLMWFNPAALADHDAHWRHGRDAYTQWQGVLHQDWRNGRRNDWRKLRHGRRIALPGAGFGHWYHGRHRPLQPYVAYRDRWSLGLAHTHGLIFVHPGIRDRHRGSARAGRARGEPLGITACYRVERLPGGHERRIPLPMSACH